MRIVEKCGARFAEITNAQYHQGLRNGGAEKEVRGMLNQAAVAGNECAEYFYGLVKNIQSALKQLGMSPVAINWEAEYQRRQAYFQSFQNPSEAHAIANQNCQRKQSGQAELPMPSAKSQFPSQVQRQPVPVGRITVANALRQIRDERVIQQNLAESGERARQAKLREHRQQVAAREQHQQKPQQETRMSKSAPHTTTSEVFALLAQNKDNRRFNSAYVKAFVSNKELFNQLKKAVEKATQPQWTAPVTKRAPIVPNHDQLDDDEVIQGEVVYTSQHGHLLPSPVAPRALPPPSGQVPVEKSAWQRLRERNSVRRR